MEQLGGGDAMWVYLESPGVPMHTGGISLYDSSTAPDGTPFELVFEHLSERGHLARAMRRKLARVPFDLDHPWWVEADDFDLKYHLRHITLPKPGDWRQLLVLAAELQARPLDMSRPLWEMYVVDGLDASSVGLPEGTFATIAKTHHATLDGVAAIELANAMHDPTPEPRHLEPTNAWRAGPEPSPWELMGRATHNFSVRPLRLAGTVGRTVPALGRVPLGLVRGKVSLPLGPSTRFNRAITSHRVIETRRYDLDDLRRIKRSVPGVTVNDVVLALVGGAMRSYLSAKGELPERSLTAMVPISVRTEAERDVGGNLLAVTTALLCTDIASPMDRLAAIHESTAKSKTFADALGARTLVEYSEYLPGALLGRGIRLAARLPGLAGTVVTNVPGPQSPLYMRGARMVRTYGMLPLLYGTGLNHMVMSYCGEVTVCVTSCPEFLPDAQAYGDEFDRSFEELAKAAGVRATSRGPRRAGRSSREPHRQL